MDKYKVFSFDIFDTLLLRPFRDPQEVWRELERQEHAKDFAKARKIADAKTYRLSSQEGRETTIEEAYAIMPKKFHHLMQKEMDLEGKILRVNPLMLEKWNEAGREGKMRVICSDMYLPKDLLESILREKGIDGWERFYLSREYNARKTTGELFKVMLKDLNVVPKEILHIGDNEWSDVKIPQRLGFQTLYYKKVYGRLFDVCPFIGTVNDYLAGTLAVGWNKFCYEHTEYAYWHRLGFMMGGVLGYMYVRWIVETSRQIGKKRLMFIARDGYVLQKICNALYPEIKTEYIYAPRMVSVAVNGVIGVDQNAMAQRQKCLDTKLKNIDLQKIREEYEKYVDSLNIDDTCALVDGCSSAFSAQRLVEECYGKELFTFYLLAMAEKSEIGALYSTSSKKSTDLHNLPFQMLSEFLFGSPEAPVYDVKNGNPVYVEDVSEQEKFKMSVSDMIAEGAVACAKALYEEKIEVNNDEWIRYCDAFMTHLTDEDIAELAKAQNAVDVEQDNYSCVTYCPHKNIECKPYYLGQFPIGIEFRIYTKKIIIFMSKRGLRVVDQNIGYKSRSIFHCNFS